MKVLKLKGTPREVGRQYGEACKAGFRQIRERAKANADQLPQWYRDIELMRAAIAEYSPDFMDELIGAAEGAGLAVEEVLLNHRSFLAARYLDPAGFGADQAIVGVDAVGEGCCTNMAFLRSPSGPIFGKNLDLAPNPDRGYVVRDVTYDDGSRIVHSVVEGEITMRDTCMNGFGLTIGGSSVGSVFRQSIRNVPIEVGIYEMLRRCATTDEAIHFLQRRPYIGKGYNFIMLDENGVGVALECPSPLLQVRLPEPGQDAIYCTNSYKLPSLAKADLRPPQGMRFSERRHSYLARKLWEERVPRTFEQIKALLSAQNDDGGLCRPIEEGDPSVTRMSVVTLPSERQFWFTDGQPCAVPYERVD
jgi:predicted choloylglycine hydrolase